MMPCHDDQNDEKAQAPGQVERASVRQLQMRVAELGEGFEVARALPTRHKRMVGPWCFLDHLGPADLSAGNGLHIGAHPHTCLQTFTWMMQGEILHRDSLGHEQIIRPGQVNIMTAGRGICHTEDSLGRDGLLHTAQLWIALPEGAHDIPPDFQHHAELPTFQVGDSEVTLLAGSFGDLTSPVRVHSGLVALDLVSDKGGDIRLDLQPGFEYAVLPCQGRVGINGTPVDHKHFAFSGAGFDHLLINLGADGRCLLIGGTPFASPVHMWWNFVAHSRDDINQAYLDWQAHADRFGQVVHASQRLEAPRPPWMAPAG